MSTITNTGQSARHDRLRCAKRGGLLHLLALQTMLNIAVKPRQINNSGVLQKGDDEGKAQQKGTRDGVQHIPVPIDATSQTGSTTMDKLERGTTSRGCSSLS